MQLRRIWYELHQADLDALESRAWAVPHEMEGQVRLEFDDAEAAYISAVLHLDSLCADYRGESHCVTPLPHQREVSAHPLWTPLIGSSIDLAFLDASRQVVAIRSPTQRVYCCSWEAGSWEADRLLICRALPRPAARSGDAATAQ